MSKIVTLLEWDRRHVSSHEREVCCKHVLCRPVDLCNLSLFSLSICSLGGRQHSLVYSRPWPLGKRRWWVERLGWATFAKQNVEEFSQHLLLSTASKTGSSYQQFTRANGQTVNICSYLSDHTVQQKSHIALSTSLYPLVPQAPQYSPY